MKPKAEAAQRLLFPLLVEPAGDKPPAALQRVAILQLRRGYAIVDDARVPLFGGLRFPTPEEAETFLEHANLRARSVRWKLHRPAARRPRRFSTQLSLF